MLSPVAGPSAPRHRCVGTPEPAECPACGYRRSRDNKCPRKSETWFTINYMASRRTTKAVLAARARYMREYRKRQKAAAVRDVVALPIPEDPAAAVAEWARSTLRVPTGPLRGQPFQLAPWQVDWLRGALAPGIREAALSCGRKSGKSGLIAVLLLSYLAGPLNSPQWRGAVCSLTGKLAKELRDACEFTAQTAGASGLAIKVCRSPTPGHIEGRNGARVDILAADASTGHSSGFDMVICDEGGLLGEQRRPLWQALYSSISGRDGRMLSISIRGDGEMFSELADRKDQPAVYWKEYAAPGRRQARR